MQINPWCTKKYINGESKEVKHYQVVDRSHMAENWGWFQRTSVGSGYGQCDTHPEAPRFPFSSFQPDNLGLFWSCSCFRTKKRSSKASNIGTCPNFLPKVPFKLEKISSQVHRPWDMGHPHNSWGTLGDASPGSRHFGWSPDARDSKSSLKYNTCLSTLQVCPRKLDDGWPESAEEHVTFVLL